jgi:hypothetical protein
MYAVFKEFKKLNLALSLVQLPANWETPDEMIEGNHVLVSRSLSSHFAKMKWRGIAHLRNFTGSNGARPAHQLGIVYPNYSWISEDHLLSLQAMEAPHQFSVIKIKYESEVNELCATNKKRLFFSLSQSTQMTDKN